MPRPSRIIFSLVLAADLLTLSFYVYTKSVSINYTERDFVAFYAASRLPYSDLYDLRQQHDIEMAVRGNAPLLPFVNPPFVVPLFKTINSDNYVTAYSRWFVFLTLISFACGYLIFVILRGCGWERPTAAIAALTAILFLPIYSSIAKGQLSPLILFVSLTALWLTQQAKEKSVGISLALALVKPHIGLMLAVPIIIRDRRIAMGFCFATCALVGLSLALIGFDGVSEMLKAVSLVGQGDGGAAQSDMLNLLGVLLRLDVEPSIARLIAWGAFVLMITFASVLSLRIKSSLTAFGLIVLLIVPFAPHIHFHDLGLLVIPMIALADMLRRRGNSDLALLFFFPLSPVLLLL